MRRRHLTRFAAVDAGLPILGPASAERDLVVVRWDKRARRRWRRRLFRARLAHIDAMLIRAGFVTPDELRAQRWPADGVPVRLDGEVVGRAWQGEDGAVMGRLYGCAALLAMAGKGASVSVGCSARGDDWSAEIMPSVVDIGDAP